jgi:hypothetical protein
MSMVTRVSVLLISAAAIASFGAPANAQSAGAITAEEWARVTAMDQQAVRAGAAPPELVQIDIALAKVIPEGQAIIASHDEAKARDWSRRFRALVARRNEVDRKFLAAHPIHLNTGPKADPCLSPMGKNICAPPPSAQPRRMCSMNFGSTVGLVPCD